jgi:S-formylglutathione hydrolase
MYDYCLTELPAQLAIAFPSLDPARASIFGHSMGGHGALVLALRNPGRFRSVSAFAPICHPTEVPWGIKAFSGYLGTEDKEAWKAYDACELLRGYAGPRLPALVDVGSADSFLEAQLKPEELQRAADAAGFPVTLRVQEGYDHSYFFIATFIEEHIAHHAAALLATAP